MQIRDTYGFAIRQIQEKCQEQNQKLYALFVALAKAFDKVSHECFWGHTLQAWLSTKVHQHHQVFYNGMIAWVVESGSVSDPFPVSDGIKQGCVLAPTLFSLMSAVVLLSALSATDAGIGVCYRCKGWFFYLRCLKAKSKVLEALVQDFLFADDCALEALNEPDLCELARCLSIATKAFVLTICLRKKGVAAART